MPTPSDGGSGFEDSESGLGGADAVPDTPDVPGHGTEPNQPWDGVATARVGAGGGPRPFAWLAAGLGLLVLLVYVVGVLLR